MNTDIWIILVFAIVIDRIFGEPPDKIHPTVWIGVIIERLKEKSYDSQRKDFIYGTLIFFVVTIPFTLASFIILKNIGSIPTILIGAYILKITFSWKSLGEHAKPIETAIAQGNLEDARKSLSKIVGRDTESLDEKHILSAAVESIGESSVDGIASPIFYYLVICSLIGVPAGVASAVFFRATSTLDSMVGYKKYGAKGYASAKIDDLMNYVPSRIMGVVIIASSFIRGTNWKNAVKVYENDRKYTPSPNSGHAMSALAGALGVGLEKEGLYSLGKGVERLESSHISKAIHLIDFSIILFIIFISASVMLV